MRDLGASQHRAGGFFPYDSVRIVSLCPSLTELVFALGRGDSLVGRTKFCVQPRDRVESVEKVGGTKNPKLERIVALAPDLVLMNEEENRREDADALRRAGVRCHTSMPRDVSGVIDVVREIGAMLDRQARADEVAHEIEATRQAVAATVAIGAPTRHAYLIWREPYMTVSSDTYVSALLAESGGVNVFGGMPERYPTVSAREIAEARPDVVLLSSEPFPFAERHADELAASTGLDRARFRLVDGELLSWHGPRTADGLRYARDVLRAGAASAPT